MKKLLSMAGMCILTTAYASNDRADWSENYKLLNANYLIYSGEPGERAAPTKNDRKIAIVVKGDPVKAIFDSLYPDAKGVTCTTEKGERLRRKGDVWCSFRPSNGYRCFMGYDLRTGQPYSGASC